jgi:tetratricopeptide (TPR) repeat protein
MALTFAVATAASVGLESAAPADPTLDMLLARGLDYGYNLDYEQALDTFRQAVEHDPGDATAHRLAAATIWMRMLFLQGAVTVEDYLGQAKARVDRRPPPAELAAQFDKHVDRALAIAEERIRATPSDADAQFQLGAAAALRTSYIAAIQGRLLDSLGTGRKAYGAHKRAMSLDATRKDAALVVGMYRYTVANLSMALRLVARLAGFEGGRETGIRLVEEAAGFHGYAQTNARFTLIVIYNREARHEDALRVIRELQQRYPRNRLLWLEEASTALRAGRPEEALQALQTGRERFADDRRAKAFGEAAQWHLQRGVALLALGQREQGIGELQAVVVADAPAWLRDRARQLLAATRS